MLISLLTLLCCFAALCLLSVQVGAVALDPDTAKALEEAIKSDEFVLSLKHIKPRKRLRGSIETLFAVDFPGSQQKFVLQLDRRTKRVVVETMEDGRTRSQHFTVDTISENSLIKSLVFAFNQEKGGAHIWLYMDCVYQGMVPTPRSMKEMFLSTDNSKLQVYRERRYVVEVDSDTSITSVLNRNNCPDTQMMQAMQPAQYNDINSQVIRGDIPIIHDCDDNMLVKAINDLIAVIKPLKEEVATLRTETHNLREMLEQCDFCRPEQGEGYY